MTVEEMDLAPEVAAKARELESAHPEVVFLSGRRTLQEQCHSMAVNIARAGRQWIRETYTPSHAITVLQQAVDAHPTIISASGLTMVLLRALQVLTPAEQNSISRHLTGRAFDVQPGSCPVSALEALRPRKLLQHEGDLARLHVDF